MLLIFGYLKKKVVKHRLHEDYQYKMLPFFPTHRMVQHLTSSKRIKNVSDSLLTYV